MLVFHTLKFCFQVLESSVGPGKGCSYIRELFIFFAKRGSSVNDASFVEEEKFLESHSDEENLSLVSRLTKKKDILMGICFPENICLLCLLICFKYDLFFNFMIKIWILIILLANFGFQKYLL